MTVFVRVAAETDVAAIARIYNEGFFEIEPRTAEQLAVTLRQRGSAYPVVMAERGRSVIAWAGKSADDEHRCNARSACAQSRWRARRVELGLVKLSY